MLLLLILAQLTAEQQSDIEDCPMQAIRSIIQEVQKETRDPNVQKRVIRRIAAETYGGDWGVIIIQDPTLASHEVSWQFPFRNNAEGTPGFCLTVVKGWLYHVVKVCGYGRSDRVRVAGIVNKIRSHVAHPTSQPELDAVTKAKKKKEKKKCKKCRKTTRS